VFGMFGGSSGDDEAEAYEHPLSCECIECSMLAPKHASGWRVKL
jgi:hypothetical protein